MTRVSFQCRACGGVYFDRAIDGTPYHHACSPLPPTKEGNTPERLNKRDENIAMGGQMRMLGIIAEGDGVTCLDNSALSEPAWITQIKAAVAAREGD